MKYPKIPVTGATGRTGSAVVDELLAKGVHVRALVHSTDACSAALERKGGRNFETTARRYAARLGSPEEFRQLARRLCRLRTYAGEGRLRPGAARPRTAFSMARNSSSGPSWSVHVFIGPLRHTAPDDRPPHVREGNES